ncbi:SDR family oxidoreductase [Arthrobacter sp. TB 23]|uniref:SDR family oxidoreductase n=1 Tax=Arthrobacter sp. TB 23 TaxID=494419 RepID=UPI00031B63FD|nr:SDR family oxidoreductase [Arthrobacter sp. TB 23]
MSEGKSPRGTVLIAGCGDLGTEAGLRFAAAGYRVIGWRRSADKLPAEIEGVPVDLTGELPPLPADTRIVVLATAADSRTEDAYRAAYLTATGNVLDALDRAGIDAQVLLVSSTAVYGGDEGEWVDESTPVAPGTATAKILASTEELLRDRRPAAIILRLSGIYGPGRTRLIDQLSSGTAVLPQEVQWTNRIHRDDAAAAIVHLTTQVGEPGPVYIGVDNEPADQGEVLEFLAAQLGVPTPQVGPASTSRTGSKRLSNAALTATGFTFTYPSFREGYLAVLNGDGVRHP